MDLLKFLLKLMEKESGLNLAVVTLGIASIIAYSTFYLPIDNFQSVNYEQVILAIFVFVIMPFVLFHLLYSAAVGALYYNLTSQAQFKTESPLSVEFIRARLIRIFAERKLEATILEPPTFPLQKIALSALQVITHTKNQFIIYSNKPFIALSFSNYQNGTQVSIYAEDTLEGRSFGKHLETTLKHN